MKMLLNPNICLISISLLVKFLDGSIFEHSPLREQQKNHSSFVGKGWRTGMEQQQTHKMSSLLNNNQDWQVNKVTA